MAPAAGPHDVADLGLAPVGRAQIEWAAQRMPVLATVRERFSAERPLAGLSVGACLHVTAETANLLRALSAGGADVALCASNPLSTHDDVAASLVTDFSVATFARRAESPADYSGHVDAVLDRAPALTVDDGCDLVARLHLERPAQAREVIGGTEDTTTGAVRLRALSAGGGLAYPIVAVSGAATRLLADNRYGTGQSTLDGVLRATNVLLAGARVAVAGYGNCGRGVAERARGMGASVIVTEVDPLRALEAAFDGFAVMPMQSAAELAEVFVTATGNRDVLRSEHFAVMRDGAILANAGHFNVEIDIDALVELAAGRRRAVRPMVEEFDVGGGKRLLLLAEGRLVNLGAADGHPAQVMDISFAVQALACEWLVQHAAELPPAVHDVPVEIDEAVARLKLTTMGLAIDELTPAQRDYLDSWLA
ncbi:MAG TPA: adenosylhomocysteinase [Acidimicrobiales bacterium]|nr:adenosylhomocysteinase [Acidimicrobiales bacterium]